MYVVPFYTELFSLHHGFYIPSIFMFILLWSLLFVFTSFWLHWFIVFPFFFAFSFQCPFSLHFLLALLLKTRTFHIAVSWPLIPSAFPAHLLCFLVTLITPICVYGLCLLPSPIFFISHRSFIYVRSSRTGHTTRSVFRKEDFWVLKIFGWICLVHQGKLAVYSHE